MSNLTYPKSTGKENKKERDFDSKGPSIPKIIKEVKELTWDYKTAKADLAFKSALSEVAKKVDTLGIKESIEPPQRLKAEEVKDEH